MRFLEKIDLIHESNRKNLNIPKENREFTSHIPITISVGEVSYGFEIRKKEKSKLLLSSGKQRIYLSDFDIINIILKMSREDQSWFIEQFISFYNGKAVPFSMIIGFERFDCRGIDHFPSKKKLLLFSDTSIDYDMFIAIVNFILEKDRCWEEISNMVGFSKTTLVKFIALVSYYSSNRTKGKHFLQSISYPVFNSFQDAYNTGSKLFEDINVQKVFDISLYI